ncbi:hypothetical protein HK405_012019 [Cladochytrium tenue]|nr:hypothetical protein HK405_012019 [Cladochytrium tenue]
MFRTDKAVPLVTLDDAALLEAERYSRKEHNKGVAGVLGGGVRVFYSPLAVIGIAKAGAKGHKNFWSHEDVLAEVKRRGLTPLPKGLDENAGVLIAGQVVAAVAGNTLGEFLGNSVVHPGVELAANHIPSEIGANATEFIGKKIAGNVAEEAVSATVNNTVDSLPAGVGGSAAPSPPSYRTPILSFLRRPRTGPASATKHLEGLWGGYARELIRVTAKATDDSEPNEKDELEPLSQDDDVPQIEEALGSQPRGIDEPASEFRVAQKYLMRLVLTFDGTSATGKSLVDPDAVVTGEADPAGRNLTLVEKSSSVEVTYVAKVAGGKIQGTWTSSDSRQGVFKLSHY